ncbi:MAG: DUF4136 domain-containing protein [Burkholderiales bacterium]|nr:DUF4136 domain-containing protein [Burkholderiales bacterium]MBI3729614.1 DUF4136 domain-containing protein [Burkholderiales bacterium]
MKKFSLLFTLACSLLLGGCATTFTSQVSVFHEWPGATQDKSYIFERAPGQENNPEHKLYEDLLRTRLQTLGFKEIGAGATPALKVELRYATTIREVKPSLFWQPGIYDPYWGLHFSRGIYRRNYLYYPTFSTWPYYPRGALDMYVRSTYLHQVQIRISEMGKNKVLADIKTSSEQDNEEISLYMPYLMDSALKDFPGKNGSTSKVEFKVEN